MLQFVPPRQKRIINKKKILKKANKKCIQQFNRRKNEQWERRNKKKTVKRVSFIHVVL